MKNTPEPRIKVCFYPNGGKGKRSHRWGGCKVSFITLEDYKRKVSPTMYDAVVHDLEKYGVYDTDTHRIKYM